MHSDSEKEEAIRKDVQGEYNKLKECFDQLTGGIAQCEPTRGIYSDCFLLHARNLIDFLCNEKRYKTYCSKCKIEIFEKETDDDVLMVDFVSDKKHFEKINLLPIVPNKLKKPYNRINKQLSHITYARLDKKNQYNFFGEDDYYKIIFKNITKYIEKYNDIVIDKNFKIKI